LPDESPLFVSFRVGVFFFALARFFCVPPFPSPSGSVPAPPPFPPGLSSTCPFYRSRTLSSFFLTVFFFLPDPPVLRRDSFQYQHTRSFTRFLQRIAPLILTSFPSVGHVSPPFADVPVFPFPLTRPFRCLSSPPSQGGASFRSPPSLDFSR